MSTTHNSLIQTVSYSNVVKLNEIPVGSIFKDISNQLYIKTNQKDLDSDNFWTCLNIDTGNLVDLEIWDTDDDNPQACVMYFPVDAQLQVRA